MDDIRCTTCHRLLARVHGEATIAVKCPRCKTVCSITITSARSAKPDSQRAAGATRERTRP